VMALRATEGPRMGDQAQGDSFAEFVERVTPRLKAALVAAVGIDRASDAAAEALAYGWEHGGELRAMTMRAGRSTHPATSGSTSG
jgi:hypothetical protein